MRSAHFFLDQDKPRTLGNTDNTNPMSETDRAKSETSDDDDDMSQDGIDEASVEKCLTKQYRQA